MNDSNNLKKNCFFLNFKMISPLYEYIFIICPTIKPYSIKGTLNYGTKK